MSQSQEALIKALEEHESTFKTDVLVAFRDRGSAMGRQRFKSWRRRFERFLRDELASAHKDFRGMMDIAGMMGLVSAKASPLEDFWLNSGERVAAFMESLKLDIQAGDYDPPSLEQQPSTPLPESTTMPKSNARVFIVHGHDHLMLREVELFVGKLGLDAVVLMDQANRGMTVIEKIETYTDVDFGIVLYTPDDMGASKSDADQGKLKPRARQNVVLEHGYLMARLGRGRVMFMSAGDGLETPSDIHGVVWTPGDGNWQMSLLRELQAAGMSVDTSRI